MTQQEPQQPVREFRVGAGGTIRASVWRNETQKGDRTVVNHSVQIQKRYFDKTDQDWKTSGSFFPDDLPRLQLALGQAYEYIMTEANGSPAANA